MKKQPEFSPITEGNSGGRSFSQDQSYIGNLTAMRGIASILTVTFHSDMFLKEIVSAQTAMLIKNGWLWVDFFFILSGFVIFHGYGDKFLSHNIKVNFFAFVRKPFINDIKNLKDQNPKGVRHAALRQFW